MNKKSAQEKPRVSGGWLEARAGFEPACDFSKGLALFALRVGFSTPTCKHRWWGGNLPTQGS